MKPEQKFKAIYFPDYKDIKPGSKSFTLAFSDKDMNLYESVKHLSSFEIRKALDVQTLEDLQDYATKQNLPVNRYCIRTLKKEVGSTRNGKNTKQLPLFGLDPIHTTFKGGKKLPLQSWYPYLEGYSPDFVKYIIENYTHKNAKVIYDPFSGSGTTPIVASSLGYSSIYSEVNPLLQFLVRIKAKARNVKKKETLAVELERILENIEKNILSNEENQELKKTYTQTFKGSKFFNDIIYSQILKTKTYINNIYFKNVLVAELITIAALCSLIESSLLKRQGDLRFRKGKELEGIDRINFIENLKSNLSRMIKDVRIIDKSIEPYLITEDARSVGKLPPLKIDAVITSPPYLNGTNYFRNTKLELWFLGYLKSDKDLNNFRRLAVTAGINDVSLNIEKKIKNTKLENLLKMLQKKAYDKRIPKMVHDYFADMLIIFQGIQKHLSRRAVLAIDLGDSIYGGVHVKTDEILISILQNIGYKFKKSITLRKRISNNGQELKQVLLIFNYEKENKNINLNKFSWKKNWNNFKKELPHQTTPFSKRNWGDNLHSLCSYQGKLKPSIANQLVSTFVPKNGSVLDIFGGVGTIPLEAALQGKKSYNFEISPAAIIISKAKLSKISKKRVLSVVEKLSLFIKNNKPNKSELTEAQSFGFNKKLKEYFHPGTLNEIILARRYFKKYGYEASENAMVLACILHILHGNRPYALSRRSHGITPFAPTGRFEYKNLVNKLNEKLERTLVQSERKDFIEGKVYYQDTTKTWPEEIKDLDAIITSPPFFDSTRFYMANWMRLWFAGWDNLDFKTEPVNFIDELQKKDFSIYDNIFMQARERLKEGAVFVLHLGKSKKCDMAKKLQEVARPWFKTLDVFEENVEDVESHGIRDKGTVVKHQFLILG